MLQHEIDPIVGHAETYESGYLQESLEWLVQDRFASPTPAPDWITDVKKAAERLERWATSVEWQSDYDYAASRRSYRFRLTTNSRPVADTLRHLSAGLVGHLVEKYHLARTAEVATNPGQIAYSLALIARSLVLVVPFRRPRPTFERNALHRFQPGGCLFSVMLPSWSPAVDRQRQVELAALRLSWMLHRAALEEAFGRIDQQLELSADGPFSSIDAKTQAKWRDRIELWTTIKVELKTLTNRAAGLIAIPEHLLERLPEKAKKHLANNLDKMPPAKLADEVGAIAAGVSIGTLKNWKRKLQQQR